MSFARFGADSDVYAYEEVDAFVCLDCRLEGGEFRCPSAGELITHLRRHRAEGHRVPEEAFTELEIESRTSTLRLSPEMTRRAQERLEQWLASATASADLRNIAARLQALPLYVDTGVCFLLRPGGELLEVRSDQSWSGEVEYRPARFHLGEEEQVRAAGRRSYPELADVVDLIGRR